MNKSIILVVLMFLLIGILSVSVSADNDKSGSNSKNGGNSKDNSDSKNSDDKDSDNDGDETSKNSGENRQRTKEESKIITRENGQRVEIERKIKINEDGEREIEIKKKIRDENGNEREVKIKIEVNTEEGKIKRKIKVEDENATFEAKTELEIEEMVENNRSIIRVNKSNGQQSEIKIMPDRALEIAIEHLKNLNFSIELKEVGDKIIYEIETNKTGRILGIIKTKIKIKVEIDPETGEIIKTRKPFRSLFIFGEDSDQVPFGEKVTLCHIPPGNPSAKHTISVGRSAASAHLRHGDFLGACEGQQPTNNTGNQTDQNNTIPNQNTTIPGNETNTNTTTINNTETNVTESNNIEVNVNINTTGNST